MKGTFIALVVSVLGAGCASIHPGEYALPLDRLHYEGPRTGLGLVISSRELNRMATPTIGTVEVTFENTTPEMIHIERVGLDFQNEAANQLVATPPDGDARAFAQAIAHRDAIELTNRKRALAGVAVAGEVMASVGSHHHDSSAVGAVGAMLALGAFVALAAAEVEEENDSLERVSFAPEDHLLVVPFAIPPGAFVRRWIALTTAAPEIPCLTSAILSYETTSGGRERVRIRIREGVAGSMWQSARCRRP
jgi:hypothetical protein